MNFEKEYYENNEFWNREEVDSLDAIRIQEVYERIPTEVNSIIDVGCGNGIFLNFVLQKERKFRKLHGVDRSKTALKYVETEKTKASIDKLPFKNNQFDLVTCQEVIEHLPCNIYETGLSELCRISKKFVIITVPNCEDIEAGLIRCPSCKTHFDPNYHLRNFSQENMSELLRPHGLKLVRSDLIGGYTELKLLSNLIQKKRMRNKENRFNVSLGCPVCGFTLIGKNKANQGQGTKKNESFQIKYKSLIKKIWPSRIKFRWIFSIYEK